jgi:hypothetical protein
MIGSEPVAPTAAPAARPRPHSRDLARVRAELASRGLLLQSDPELPSVATLVAGEKIRGSWWAHPHGAEIYAVSEALAEEAHALAVKLVRGKITWVAPRLEPALFAVARSRARWQTEGLTASARALLAHVDRDGRADAERLPAPFGAAPDWRSAIHELEARLLVYTESVHTASGRHERRLVDWGALAASRGAAGRKRVSVSDGRAQLERAARALDAGTERRATLPWEGRR